MDNIYKLSLRDGVGERGRVKKRGEKSNELSKGKEKREQRNKLAFYIVEACTKILSLHLSETCQSEQHTDN